MQLFSIILVCSVFVLLLKKKRIFAPEGIFFIGTAFYGLPLYYGYTKFVSSYSPLITYSSDVSLFQYGIYNCNIILCGIIAYLPNIPFQAFYHKLKKYFKNIFKSFYIFKSNSLGFSEFYFVKKNISTLFFILNLIFLSLILFDSQAYNLIGQSKLLFSKKLAPYYNWASLTTTYCFVYFACSQKEKMDYVKIIPPIAFLILDLLMGYRITTVLSLLSIFIALSLKNKNIYNLKFFLFFIAVIMSMFAFKNIYFGGNFSQIFSLDIVLRSEPFTISSTFEKALENISIIKEMTQRDEYFKVSFLQIFPFYETLSGLNRVAFNAYIQFLFPETIWGLASNPYIELMIFGGAFAIFIYMSIIFLVIVLFKNIKENHIKYSFCVFLPYILFYSFRNDFLYPIYIIKNIIILNFLCIAILLFSFYLLKMFDLLFRDKVYE